MVGRIKARAYAMAGMLAWCFGSPVHALAVDAPRLSIQSGVKLSGTLNDGDIITQGRIVTQDAHSGFQVWSDAFKPDGVPNRYIVAGTRNAGNKLRVRIEKEGAHPDTMGGKGIVIDTGDNVTSFNVVSDGDQTVAVDNYLFGIRGTTIGLNGACSRESVLQTVPLNFTAEQRLEHELYAVSPVFPNQVGDNQLLARGVVKTRDGSPQKIAVRFAQGDGERNTDAKSILLSGRYNTEHKLSVELHFQDDITEQDTWLLNTRTRSTFDYTVNAKGKQNVPTDSYQVKVESALWGR